MSSEVERVARAIKEEGEDNAELAVHGHLHLTWQEATVLARAAIAAMQPQWREIETAPKDGRPVLVYRNVSGWDVIGTGLLGGRGRRRLRMDLSRRVGPARQSRARRSVTLAAASRSSRRARDGRGRVSL
jgi:hypothetical protein